MEGVGKNQRTHVHMAMLIDRDAMIEHTLPSERSKCTHAYCVYLN